MYIVITKSSISGKLWKSGFKHLVKVMFIGKKKAQRGLSICVCAHVCSEFNLEYIRYRKWLEIKSITVFIEEHGTILFFLYYVFFNLPELLFNPKLYGRCNTLIVYNLLTSGKTLFIGIFISCVFRNT